MIGPELWLGEARCHDELVEVMRERKASLGISNELLDFLANLTNGHIDKILGPSQTRGLSQVSLDGLLHALAIRLVIVEDSAQAAVMRPRWEKKDCRQVRPRMRLAKALVARARREVLRQLTSRASKARWSRVSPDVRSLLMREVALARWRARTNASAPVPQQETAGAS